MKKGDVLNGYKIIEDFKVAGGMSKISFAKKDGKQYFIKEFLSPKYPTEESPGSEKTKEQKRKDCQAFEERHKKINQLIKKKVSLGGNLVWAVDFFRNGTSYYKVTEKVDTKSMSIDGISRLPKKSITIIAKSVCHSLRILHELNIVHGDLKPDNILIKQTPEGVFIGKLIDFDDSYFSKNPPKNREAIVGTPEYYSPELAAYIMDEDEEMLRDTLTLASDIFTLGIILCEYYTGAKPQSRSGKPVWKAIADGDTITFGKELPKELSNVLLEMMSLDCRKRPNINDVLNKLKTIKFDKEKTTRIRGKGLDFASNGEIESPGDPSKPNSALHGKGLDIVHE